MTTKEQKRKYQRDYYSKHKEELAKKSKEHYLERSIWFKEIKSQLFCIKCGENHISCLEFHHRDPNEKEKAICIVAYYWSKKRVLDEIAKCDVLCSNCHRKHHYEESNSKI